MAAIFPSLMAISARRAGVPVPSMREPFLMRRSNPTFGVGLAVGEAGLVTSFAVLGAEVVVFAGGLAVGLEGAAFLTGALFLGGVAAVRLSGRRAARRADRRRPGRMGG